MESTRLSQERIVLQMSSFGFTCSLLFLYLLSSLTMEYLLKLSHQVFVSAESCPYHFPKSSHKRSNGGYTSAPAIDGLPSEVFTQNLTCDFCGGAVASWLVPSSPDRAVRVRALAGDTMLCSWARHVTLTVPLSTQEHK